MRKSMYAVTALAALALVGAGCAADLSGTAEVNTAPPRAVAPAKAPDAMKAPANSDQAVDAAVDAALKSAASDDEKSAAAADAAVSAANDKASLDAMTSGSYDAQ